VTVCKVYLRRWQGFYWGKKIVIGTMHLADTGQSVRPRMMICEELDLGSIPRHVTDTIKPKIIDFCGPSASAGTSITTGAPKILAIHG
jgi:hypothetical protein